MSYRISKLCPGWLELKPLKETLDGEPIGEVLRVGPNTPFAVGTLVIYDPDEMTGVMDLVLVRSDSVSGWVEKTPEKKPE